MTTFYYYSVKSGSQINTFSKFFLFYLYNCTNSLFLQIPPFFGSPVLIRTGLVSRFTSIAVDPQVGTTEGKTYDVIFVGTTKGRVIKTINAQSADSREGVKTVVIEELQVSSRQF